LNRFDFPIGSDRIPAYGIWVLTSGPTRSLEQCPFPDVGCFGIGENKAILGGRKLSDSDEELQALGSSMRHQKSIEYIMEASQYIAGGVNSNVRLGGQPGPLCFKSARGALLTDLDGNEYIDYAAGMGPALLGHANEDLVRAVSESLHLGQLYAGQSELELELAKRLQAVIPCAELVRIGMSGSEMVQTAIRAARSFTNRRKCIKFEGHYHGWFDNVLLNLTSSPIDPGCRSSTIPVRESLGQSEAAASDTVVLPWNDLKCLTEYLDEHVDDIACIIMEPVMCNSGVIPPVAGYLEAVRALCDKHSIVFVMDEVITGFRLGISGAQGKFGVIPDIATYAKAFGGGFPVAAVAGKATIMNAIGTGAVTHSGTYNANLVSLSAGIATIDLLRENDGAVYKKIERVGKAIMDGIRSIATANAPSLRVQGFPSVFNTYFSESDGIRDYAQLKNCDNARQREFLGLLQDHGIRPTSRGTWFVTAAHDENFVEKTLEAVRRVLDRM